MRFSSFLSICLVISTSVSFAQGVSSTIQIKDIEQKVLELDSANREIKELRESIKSNIGSQKAALYIGISTATVTILLGTVGAFVTSLESMTALNSPKYFRMTPVRIAGATALASGASFVWYRIKASDLPGLNSQLSKTQTRCDAAQRAYQALLSTADKN